MYPTQMALYFLVYPGVGPGNPSSPPHGSIHGLPSMASKGQPFKYLIFLHLGESWNFHNLTLSFTCEHGSQYCPLLLHIKSFELYHEIVYFLTYILSRAAHDNLPKLTPLS